MVLPAGRQGWNWQITLRAWKAYELISIFELMFWVYAISSLNRSYVYVGMTEDLDQRIKRHNSGYEPTTRPYAPFEIIYSETHETRLKARVREKYWKSGIGKEKLRILIREK